MNKGNTGLKKVGLVILIIGIVALIAGVVALMLTGVGGVIWVIAASIVINIIGINLMIHKPTQG